MINRHRPVWIQWLLGQYGRSPAALARRDAAAKQTTAIFLTDQNPWECTGYHVPIADETGLSYEALAIGLGLDEMRALTDLAVSGPNEASTTPDSDMPTVERPRAVNE